MDTRHYWPVGDIYFSHGVSSVMEKAGLLAEEQGYLFINLDGSSLVDFLSCFGELRFSKRAVVIIVSQKLKPLALFYLAELESVIAVFYNTTSEEKIVMWLSDTLNGKHKMKPQDFNSCFLNQQDVLLLTFVLKGYSIRFIQRYFARGYSTIYCWKAKLASKLGVKKIEHLLLKKVSTHDITTRYLNDAA
ncbi:hypothetical protein [Serratia silvae]|uniref:LuxR family transcriptional regulator n=1 Tax=Serratia silvae TaxID=2824122 RepID=A0ABT0K9V7_9GAMM|nr:hypothetical protein [Serratia silvae]MCL1028806.1 hypothetical protein [Serratia silvae]